MIKCRVCKDLIGPSSPIYKISRGFIQDEILIEDASIIIHLDCYNYSVGDIAEVLEAAIKNT